MLNKQHKSIQEFFEGSEVKPFRFETFKISKDTYVVSYTRTYDGTILYYTVRTFRRKYRDKRFKVSHRINRKVDRLWLKLV
jgi:hypothetical protein